MIQKAVDGLMKSIEEMLSEAVASIFEWLIEILKISLDMNGKEGYEQFSPGGMIKANPFSFNGGKIWKQIYGISDDVIIPVAILILTVVLVNDLIQAMISGNQFENVGIGVFFKWFIKATVGITLVSNVFVIANWVFFLGSYVGEKGAGIITGDTLSLSMSPSGNIGELLIMLIIAILTFLGVCLLLIAIVVTLASRIIEAFMYLAIAPIPMASYMNSEWRRMGDNWLRGIIAIAFQGFFIVVAIAIFKGLLISVVGSINANSGAEGSDAIFQMLILFAYTLALIMTVLRSGSISKSIFSAG